MVRAVCLAGLTIFFVSWAGVDEKASDIFRDITLESGIEFVHDQLKGAFFFPEIMGSGCAFLDYDKDNDLDVYLVNGSQGNRLFRQDSNGKFADVTESSTLKGRGYGMGIAVGDYDNDGYPDVYLSNYGSDALYLNNKDGTFTDVSRAAGIQDNEWGTSVTFMDYDLDGFLDIFVANYVLVDSSVICTDRAGRRDYCGPDGYEGEPDLLYHNNGNGTFTNVSMQSGIGKLRGKGLGVISADFNEDNYPDIYVANDREPNFLWINQHNGTFKNAALVMGAAVNAMGQPEASMGIALGDANEDGLNDLFVTNLREETNIFYRNAGKIGFLDDTAISGLGPASLPFTGFGTGFFDYDHDGDLDLAIANGRVVRGPRLTNQRSYWNDYAEPNLLFENQGFGRFQNVTSRAGSFGSLIENSRGLAFGDVDNDGDVDLLLTNCGGSARLFRNESKKKGHWVMIRVVDPRWKRDAVGAVVTVMAGNKRFVRIVQPGYSYLSSNDPRIHIGLGANKEVDRVTVRWPDGSVETFPGTPADRLITIYKGKGK